MRDWDRRRAHIANRVLMLSLVAVLSTVPVAPGVAKQETRPFGDARILSTVPSPGFPEGIAVRGDTVFVAGAATFGTTARVPSAVLAFHSATGEQLARYDVRGENLLEEHANSSIAFDESGRLYVLNTQLGIYRLHPDSGVQERYSEPFPNLAPCVGGESERMYCSPTIADQPPIPNDLAFDPAGNAYVTDSMQATIWRVPAGGGAPQVWFQDQRLASEYIGVNGIRLDPQKKRFFLTVSSDLQGRALVYTLPLVAAPTAQDLVPFHQYEPGTLPDGIAFGRSGSLYVALAGVGLSGLSVLTPDGKEAIRLRNPAGSPSSPYDSPANIAFDGHGRALLTNHAIVTGFVDPTRFSILDVYIADKGAPLEKPDLP